MLEESVSQHYSNEPQRLIVLAELMSKVNNCQGRETRLLSGDDFEGLNDLEQVRDVDLVDGVYKVSANVVDRSDRSDRVDGISKIDRVDRIDISNTGEIANIKAIADEATKSPYLLVGMGQSYQLGYGQTTIGRLEGNDIRINDNFVSRHHAVIVVHSNNKVEIFESSRNGTRVNNIDIVHSFLKPNDEIVIGPQRCNYKFVLSKVMEVREVVDSTNASSDNNKDVYVDEDNKEYLPLTVTSKRLNVNVEVKPNKSQKVRRPNNSKSHSHSKSIVAGFSLIELLVVIVTAGILATISVPNLLTTKRSANSASAVQSLRLISSSQAAYSTGVYIFVFNKVSANPSTNTLPSYQISARPLFTNGLTASGNKSFFVDSSAVIRFSPTPTPPFADSNSQPLN